MNHVIKSLKSHLEPRIDDFIGEWETNEYDNISECPSYGEVKVLVECINKIVKFYYFEPEEYLHETPREIIKNKEWFKNN